jgi:hypothetical protein
MDTVRCYDKSNNKTLKSNNCNCKINTNEYYKIYRLNNKDIIALKNKKYRDANPTYNIDNWNKNREILLEKQRNKEKNDLTTENS